MPNITPESNIVVQEVFCPYPVVKSATNLSVNVTAMKVQSAITGGQIGNKCVFREKVVEQFPAIAVHIHIVF